MAVIVGELVTLYQKARIIKEDDPMVGREVWTRFGEPVLFLVRDADKEKVEHCRKSKGYFTNVLSPTKRPDDISEYCIVSADATELICEFSQEVPDEEW